jgi:hypothetical protein
VRYNGNGVQLVCEWCATGVRFVCEWCATGVRMVCEWCAVGVLGVIVINHTQTYTIAGVNLCLCGL